MRVVIAGGGNVGQFIASDLRELWGKTETAGA